MGIRGSLWVAEYRCGKQMISHICGKQRIYVGNRVSKRKTECLFGKPNISSESRVHISARNRGYVWEREVL